MEEHLSHLNELEGLNSELDGLLSDLKGREESSSSRIRDLEGQLEAARAGADSAAAVMAAQEASLSMALQEARTSLRKELSRFTALSSERDDLAAKLDSTLRLLEEERARSSEKELFIKSSQSAIRDSKAESDKIWRAMEELKGELAAERAAVKERESQLFKFVKLREGLEQKLAQAARESARSEEGFLLKVDLVKKELKEQIKRCEELGRSLTTVGERLDEALDELARKEELLSSARAALAEKESLLRSANARIRDISKGAGGSRESSRGADPAGSKSASLPGGGEVRADLPQEYAPGSKEKLYKLQLALNETQDALRQKAEENAALRAREDSILGDLHNSEEKLKLSSVQLHNAVSKLKDAENENEASAGRIRKLEAERDRLRAAAVKAGAVAREQRTTDGEADSGAGYMPGFEELVAGVAHQIANSISIIRSHAEYCAESPEADGARDSLAVIVRNIVALQNKIDAIMSFSKPVVVQRSPEKLPAIAAEVLESLRVAGRLGKAKAKFEGGRELSSINVDRVRVAAALEQLLLNAAEAMPAGGEILLKFSSSGGRQRLEIRDSGEGIEKKNMGAVFHPFFTTRPGKMGLGLTMARNVARAHGGVLDIASEPGRGTRALLELPE